MLHATSKGLEKLREGGWFSFRDVFRITYCMFHDFYTLMEVPELTTIGCTFDNISFNSYLPEEVTFHRNGVGNRIADGAPACHFVLEHHSGREE